MEEKETKENKMEKWVKEHEPHIAGGMAIVIVCVPAGRCERLKYTG